MILIAFSKDNPVRVQRIVWQREKRRPSSLDIKIRPFTEEWGGAWEGEWEREGILRADSVPVRPTLFQYHLLLFWVTGPVNGSSGPTNQMGLRAIVCFLGQSMGPWDNPGLKPPT